MNRTVHGLHGARGNRQSDPESMMILLATLERLEEQVFCSWRQTAAFVCHVDHDSAVGSVRMNATCPFARVYLIAF